MLSDCDLQIGEDLRQQVGERCGGHGDGGERVLVGVGEHAAIAGPLQLADGVVAEIERRVGGGELGDLRGGEALGDAGFDGLVLDEAGPDAEDVRDVLLERADGRLLQAVEQPLNSAVLLMASSSVFFQSSSRPAQVTRLNLRDGIVAEGQFRFGSEGRRIDGGRRAGRGSEGLRIGEQREETFEDGGGNQAGEGLVEQRLGHGHQVCGRRVLRGDLGEAGGGLLQQGELRVFVDLVLRRPGRTGDAAGTAGLRPSKPRGLDDLCVLYKLQRGVEEHVLVKRRDRACRRRA